MHLGVSYPVQFGNLIEIIHFQYTFAYYNLSFECITVINTKIIKVSIKNFMMALHSIKPPDRVKEAIRYKYDSLRNEKVQAYFRTVQIASSTADRSKQNCSFSELNKDAQAKTARCLLLVLATIKTQAILSQLSGTPILLTQILCLPTSRLPPVTISFALQWRNFC